jgi:nesprin-1
MLENIDRRKNEIIPVDSHLDPEILQDHHKQLRVRTLAACGYF